MGRRSDAAYDLRIETEDGVSIGLMLDQDSRRMKRIAGSLGPADAAEAFRSQDVPRIWRGFADGMGATFVTPVMPNGYDYGLNICTRTPGVALPAGKLTEVTLPSTGGAKGPFRSSFELFSNLYLVTNRYVFKIGNGVGSPSLEADLVSVTGLGDYVNASAAVHGGNTAYLGGIKTSGGAAWLIKFDGSSWTASADVARWLLASVYQTDSDGNGGMRLFGTMSDGKSFKYVTGSTDPMSDVNWLPASAIPVGNQGFSITSLATSNQRLFFCKQEGTYEALRAGTYVPNITPYTKDNLWQFNGAASLVLNGALYVTMQRAIDMVPGLDGRRNDTPTQIQPGADLPFEGPVGGACWAMTQDNGWLVAAFHNDTNQTSYVMYGKPAEQVLGAAGGTRFVWHGAEVVTPAGQKINRLHVVAPYGNPRLYIGTYEIANETPHLYWASLPRLGLPMQELVSGGAHTFANSASLYLSSESWGTDATALKTLRRMSVVARGLSSAAHLTLYANPDETGWSQIGPPINQSPYQAASLTGNAAVRGRNIAVRVDFAGEDSEPPVLRALKLRGGLFVEPYQTRQARVVFGDGTLLNNGGRDNRDPFTVWNQLLVAMQDRVTLHDVMGRSYQAQLHQASAWIEEDRITPDTWERVANISWTELRRNIRWNDGTVWDAGDEWP